MANQITYNDQPFAVGDTIKISYKIKEADNKERLQDFEGILLKIKGHTLDNRMITVRKMSRDGIGIERIIPVTSPFIAAIKLVKKSNYQKSKLYFVRELSDQKLRNKLYSKKKSA
jgi:large subunit ribosomal protein L19